MKTKATITGFVTRSTRRVSLVEQELPTLPEHLSSPPIFRVTRSLGLYVCFVERCTFFFWPLCCQFFFDIDSDYPFGIFKLFLQTLNIEQYYRPSHKCLTYEYSKPLYLPILQSLCLTIRHHLSNNFTDNHRNKATLLKKKYDPQGYRYNVVMIYF